MLSRPMATKRFLAMLPDVTVAGKVSTMAWPMMSGVNRLRMTEMDRRARSENLASKRATARSSKAKLLLMSAKWRN